MWCNAGAWTLDCVPLMQSAVSAWLTMPQCARTTWQCMRGLKYTAGTGWDEALPNLQYPRFLPKHDLVLAAPHATTARKPIKHPNQKLLLKSTLSRFGQATTLRVHMPHPTPRSHTMHVHGCAHARKNTQAPAHVVRPRRTAASCTVQSKPCLGARPRHQGLMLPPGW